MGFYTDHVLPRIQDALLDLPQTRLTRRRVCAGLSGDVIEIGFGSGLNLPHLPAQVDGVWAVEPARLGTRLSQRRRAATPVPVLLAATDAQHLPLEDARFDSALSTWTLCTIPDPVAALREVGRVLRAGGVLRFVEHGLAPDRTVARWQRRLTPLQRRLAGGCHLDREIPALFEEAGWEVTQLDTYYEARAPRVLGFMYEGEAVAR